MSHAANTHHRRRAFEPAELERAELRRQQRCITPGCGLPSATQRCAGCRAKVEANTDRSRGRGERGSPTKLETDVLDLRLAVAAATKALAQWTELARAGVTGKERDRALLEPRSQAELADRHLRDVLRRYKPVRVADHRRPKSRGPQQLSLPWPKSMGAR